VVAIGYRRSQIEEGTVPFAMEKRTSSIMSLSFWKNERSVGRNRNRANDFPPASGTGGGPVPQIRPTDWLSLGGTFTYTNARYSDGNVSVLGASELFGRVADTPKLTGTIYADVTIPLPRDLVVTVHDDLYGQPNLCTGPSSQNAAGTKMPRRRDGPCQPA
jgi:hypothetical protein